jgi:hypothetical protein
LILDPDFVNGQYSTAFLSADRMERLLAAQPPQNEEIAAIAAAIAGYDRELSRRPPEQANVAQNPWKWSLR